MLPYDYKFDQDISSPKKTYQSDIRLIENSIIASDYYLLILILDKAQNATVETLFF